MKECGIIMSAPNPTLILSGRKTQTRRLMQFQPGKFQHFEDDVNEKGEIRFWWDVDKGDGNVDQEYSPVIRCPYGTAGDRLYVREAWRPLISRTRSSGNQRYAYRADHPSPSALDGTWKPSIHMPKVASRIWLEIMRVRVERLQDISAGDCIAEGIDYESHKCGCEACSRSSAICPASSSSLILAYAELWDRLHGAGEWEKNPWVWVLEFKRV